MIKRLIIKTILLTTPTVFGILFSLLLVSTESIAQCTTGDCVDFADSIGTVNLIYGANEDNNWYYFATNDVLQQRHREAGTRSIRVWLSAQYYRESTFPYDGKTYDWKNVDLFINAALKACVGNNPPLYITFSHYDICGDAAEQTPPFDFSSCEGHASYPPSSDSAFADYVVTVIKHFRSKSNSGGYAKPCSVNDWYFEIWNEPNWGGDCWATDKIYKPMFETVHRWVKDSIEQVYNDVDKLKLSAYWDADSTEGAGFQVVHLYADNICSGGDQEKMDCIAHMFDDSVSASGVPVINSEYNNTYDGYSYTDFAASWLTAALINQVKSGIHMEHVYSGTGRISGTPADEQYVYGMWGIDGTPWPAYYMKKQFVENHPSYPERSTIYRSDLSNENFYILATKKQGDGKKAITIVNRKGVNNSLDLEIVNGGSGSGIKKLSFTGYEVKLLELEGVAVLKEFDSKKYGYKNINFTNLICLDKLIKMKSEVKIYNLSGKLVEVNSVKNGGVYLIKIKGVQKIHKFVLVK